MRKQDANPGPLERYHRVVGWWTLFGFASFGLLLEALHGFKVGWYVDAMNGPRRLMWTLAHAHGTLLGLIHLGVASVMGSASDWALTSRRLASRCLVGATVLLPGGFLLGGLRVYGGDPGLGAILVPLGGVLLIVALYLTARAATLGGVR
jgi:hypothetical protein